VRLSIADDGRGGIARHGNGLDGMKERLASVRGTLDIDSAAGAGTRLILRVPRSPQGAQA
jgi:two-component system sensor histidine kinase DesK